MALARKIDPQRSVQGQFRQPFGENAKGVETMIEVTRPQFSRFIFNLSVRYPLDKLRSDEPDMWVEYFKNPNNEIIAARTLGDEQLRRYYINGAKKAQGMPDLPPEVIPPDPVPILSLWNTNPALVLVASTDITKFRDGDMVDVAGVQPPWATLVNGQHIIANVGGGQFELVDVDLTLAMSTIGDPGMTVTPPASLPSSS